MKKQLQSYSASGLTVNFDPNLCDHSAVCLKSMPEVFDVRRKRWVRPEAATIEEVIETVNKCPSGALSYLREGNAEQVADTNEMDSSTTIQVSRNGPFLVQGPFVLQDVNGTTISSPGRAALCRCGCSGNQPFCEGTHLSIEFRSGKLPL